MSTLRHLTLLSVLAVATVACSDDSACACTDTTPPSPATTIAALDTTVASTGGGADTTQVAFESTVAPTAIDGPVQIDVLVGTDSGPDRVELVKVGADVTLNITNPSAADEYHVHGIDLEQKADAGVMVTLNFTIDAPGTYEVESHVTEDVLLVIEVV